MTARSPIPYTVAQNRLLEMIEPLGSETIPTAQALGRCASEPLYARRSQPAADVSAMDGYAMLANDCDGPWRVIGESAAGHPFDGALKRGESVRISTGALMPTNAGAVLIQENADRRADNVSSIAGAVPRTEHVRRAGFDFCEGDQLLPQGACFNPAQIALAVSSGHATVTVGKQPKVAFIDSGDELVANPGDAAAYQIPASNGPMLAAMAKPLASKVDYMGPVSDSIGSLLDAFDTAASADVIVTSGGASVGDHDLIRPALERWGATIDFWRIMMKPGKPMLVAKKGTTTILGLPGNPVSSYVTAYLFMLPLLRKLAGDLSPLPTPRSYILSNALPTGGPRAEFVRAEITGDRVRALKVQDSSALVSLSRANGLILRDSEAPEAKSGDRVPVFHLQNGGIA